MKAASTATALAVVSTLGIGVALCSHAPPPTVLAAGPTLVADEGSGSDPDGGSEPIRVATWNINSVRLRRPLLAELVRALNPDVDRKSVV